MKKQALILFLSLLFLASFTFTANEDCSTQLTSEVYQDTASKSLLMMCSPITEETINSCKTLDYLLTNKEGVASAINLKTVYAVNFYLKNNTAITLNFYFCSLDQQGQEQWTKSSSANFNSSAGRYQSFALAISPINSAFQVNAVTKIRINVNSEGNFLLDELGLEYYNIEKKEPDFEVKKQLKKVKADFKDKKDKDRAERWVRDHGNIR